MNTTSMPFNYDNYSNSNSYNYNYENTNNYSNEEFHSMIQQLTRLANVQATSLLDIQNTLTSLYHTVIELEILQNL